MADQNPKDINTVNLVDSIDAQDAIFFSDGGSSTATNSGNNGVLRKIDYNKLAKAIIEQYNGSQLMGATKTIQAAFNELNSKFIYATSIDDLCTNILALPSNRTATLYITSTVTSALINVNMVGKGYVSKVSNVIADIVIYAGANGELYTIRINPTTKVVSTDNTTKLPTRAEVDTLSSKIAWIDFNNTDILTQIDALSRGAYDGYLSATNAVNSDMPGASTSWYVRVQKNSANYATVWIESIGNPGNRTYIKHKDNGTWNSNWVQLPTREEINTLSSNLGLEYKGRLEVTGSTGDSIAITEGVGAHFIHIVACGMWNSSVLLAVFPANGGEPRVKVIATYANTDTPSIPVTITANGNYGLTITNTTSNTCPLTVYAIRKAN